MLDTIVAIIKAIWPYLRESFFEGKPLGVWLRKYRWTISWLGLVIILVLTVFYMFDQNIALQIEANNANKKAVVMEKNYKIYLKAWEVRKAKSDAFEKELQETKEELATSQENLTDKEEELSRHRDWARMCGLDPKNIGAGTAACPVRVTVRHGSPSSGRRANPRPKTTPKPPTQEPEKEEASPTLRERLKRLFGGDKN